MEKFILLIIFLAIIPIFPIFAQEELTGQKIILETNESAYHQGDVITITGIVEKVISGDEVILQIFFDKNLMEVAQITVTGDGKFTKTFVADGPMWQNEGVVLLKATYGQETSELSFKFFKSTGTEFASTYEVDIPGSGTFDVLYTMKGGVINSMELNSNDLSLDIIIDTNSNGSLDIQIPRDSLDALNQDGVDEKFIVLIYKFGEQVPIQTDFNELEKTDESRAIYIPIKKGDGKIQIIGTVVIPEFGTIAAIILAVAITSIIIITTRTKLPIFTKH